MFAVIGLIICANLSVRNYEFYRKPESEIESATMAVSRISNFEIRGFDITFNKCGDDLISRPALPVSLDRANFEIGFPV